MGVPLGPGSGAFNALRHASDMDIDAADGADKGLALIVYRCYVFLGDLGMFGLHARWAGGSLYRPSATAAICTPTNRAIFCRGSALLATALRWEQGLRLCKGLLQKGIARALFSS
jgi:hypothetical protein